MKVNNQVTWSSQAQGCTTTKTGTIAAVVPAGTEPKDHLFLKRHGLQEYTRRFDGWPRDHESYLVLVKVGKTDKAKPMLYWPRVSGLKVVSE